MRTANPALNDKTFEGFGSYAASNQAMSIQGTVNKTGILLLLAMFTASIAWSKYNPQMAGETLGGVKPLMGVGAIGGFIFAIITTMKPNWAALTAPIYALLEGLFLGGISVVFEMMYQGIVMQAVGITFGVMVSLLLAYKTGLIKATENFKLGVAAATGGIFLMYMATWILGFFGISMPFIHGSGPLGIGISMFIVVIAALNLVLDFDFIEEGARRGAPKHMEWYAAFGLMVTLVWLYVEILRLLSKLRDR